MCAACVHGSQFTHKTKECMIYRNKGGRGKYGFCESSCVGEEGLRGGLRGRLLRGGLRGRGGLFGGNGGGINGYGVCESSCVSSQEMGEGVRGGGGEARRLEGEARRLEGEARRFGEALRLREPLCLGGEALRLRAGKVYLF